MHNYQFYSIMMMLDMLMSFQIRGNKFWTWFWVVSAALNMVLAAVNFWVGR